MIVKMSLYTVEKAKQLKKFCKIIVYVIIHREQEKQSKKRKTEIPNSSSECSIRLASGKAISPALLAKLKNQIADNEKMK